MYFKQLVKVQRLNVCSTKNGASIPSSQQSSGNMCLGRRTVEIEAREDGVKLSPRLDMSAACVNSQQLCLSAQDMHRAQPVSSADWKGLMSARSSGGTIGSCWRLEDEESVSSVAVAPSGAPVGGTTPKCIWAAQTGLSGL